MDNLIDDELESWDSPSEEEISAAANRALGGEKEDGDEPDGSDKSGTPKPDGAEKADAPAAEASEGAEGEEEEVIVVKGKKYTPAEIIELERGTLREADYTRKQQQLAEERRTIEAQRRAAEEERAFYAEERRRLQAERGTGEEAEEDEPLPSAAQRRFDAQQKEIEALKQRDEARVRETRLDDEAKIIANTFESELESCFKEFNVPADRRKLYERAVIGCDPSPFDEGDKEQSQISVEALRRNTRAAFLDIQGDSTNNDRSMRESVVDELRKSSPKPSNAKPSPRKPAEREPGRSSLLPEPEGRPRDWSTHGAVKDMLTRLSEIGNG